MRTIKFRGIGKRTGTWIYGNLIQLGGAYIIVPVYDEYEVIPDHSTECALGFHEDEFDVIKPDSLCQFTGANDASGKEIYEGDIVHLKGDNYDKDFGIVKWHTNGYFYIDDNFGKFPKDKTNPIGDFFDFISRDFKGIEVSISGNIHDNPELLKKKY